MTTLGLIFAAAFAVSLLWGRRGVLVVLAASVAFNSSAAIAVGDITVTPFYMGMLLYIPLALLSPSLQRDGRSSKLTILLVVFFLWSAAVTVFAPMFFEGLGVIAPGIGIDEQVGALTPLAASLSNIAQVVYLGLNLLLIGLNDRDGLLGVKHITIGFIVGLAVALVGFLAWRGFLPWPYELFDNSPRGFYAESALRLRSQFAEPSQLGGFALTALAYFGARAATVKTHGRVWASLALAGVAGLLLAASAAGTAIIGAVVAVGVVGIVCLIRWLRLPPPRKVHPLAFLIGLAVIVFAVAAIPAAIDYVQDTVEDKVGGTSFANRNYANEHALSLLWQTNLFGVGLGSNRSSSLALMLLSTIGVVGFVCFLMLVFRAIRSSMTDERFPAAIALIAFLSAAFVSLADFASPYMWLLIAVCAPILVRRSAPPAEPDETEPAATRPARRLRPAPTSRPVRA